MEPLVIGPHHSQALNLGKYIAQAQNRPLNEEEVVGHEDSEGAGRGG